MFLTVACASACSRPPQPEGASPAGGSGSGEAKAAAAPSATPTASSPARVVPEGWKSFEPTAGVSVLVPGEPQNLGGVPDSPVFGVKRPSGSAFMVSCTDLGAHASAKDVRDTIAGMRKGKIGERAVRSEKAVERDGMKGHRLEIVMETTKGKLIMNELLLGQGRLACDFSVLVKEGVDESKDVDRFFDSATLNP